MPVGERIGWCEARKKRVAECGAGGDMHESAMPVLELDEGELAEGEQARDDHGRFASEADDSAGRVSSPREAAVKYSRAANALGKKAEKVGGAFHRMDAEKAHIGAARVHREVAEMDQRAGMQKSAAKHLSAANGHDAKATMYSFRESRVSVPGYAGDTDVVIASSMDESG